MTDFATNASITVRRFSLPRLGFPRFAIGQSLSDISVMLGDAFNLAYVDPYTGIHRRQPAVPDNDLEGRDPNW